MKLRNIPFSPPDMTEAEVNEVREAILSGWITTGPKTKEFERLIAEDRLLEHAEYVGNCYGTPKSYVERCCAEGMHVLLDIDVQGVHQISENRPDAIRVFMMPPSLAELEHRLRGRHTDDEQKICERLAQARRECALAYTYDYIVINDDPDVASKELDAIITAECCRYPDRKNYFTEVLEK